MRSVPENFSFATKRLPLANALNSGKPIHVIYHENEHRCSVHIPTTGSFWIKCNNEPLTLPEDFNDFLVKYFDSRYDKTVPVTLDVFINLKEHRVRVIDIWSMHISLKNYLERITKLNELFKPISTEKFTVEVERVTEASNHIDLKRSLITKSIVSNLQHGEELFFEGKSNSLVMIIGRGTIKVKKQILLRKNPYVHEGELCASLVAAYNNNAPTEPILEYVNQRVGQIIEMTVDEPVYIAGGNCFGTLCASFLVHDQRSIFIEQPPETSVEPKDVILCDNLRKRVDGVKYFQSFVLAEVGNKNKRKLMPLLSICNVVSPQGIGSELKFLVESEPAKPSDYRLKAVSRWLDNLNQIADKNIIADLDIAQLRRVLKFCKVFNSQTNPKKNPNQIQRGKVGGKGNNKKSKVSL